MGFPFNNPLIKKLSKLFTPDGSTQAVTVDATGNVGIGVTNPEANLHVKRSVNGVGGNIFAQNPNTGTGALTSIGLGGSGPNGYLDIYQFGGSYTTSGQYIQNSGLIEGRSSAGLGISAVDAAGTIRFYTAGAFERMRINKDGNAGFGTPNPIFRVDAAGGIYSRLCFGRFLFDDAPVGTQLILSPSGVALLAVPGGTNYAAANVTLQANGLQAVTTALDDDSVTVRLALPVLNTSQNPKVSFRFKIDSVANAFVGVGLAAGAFNNKAVPDNNFGLIGMDADNGHGFGAARLVLITRDNGGAVDYDDLGSNMADNTWVWGVVDFTDPLQPRVFINGTEIAAGNITGTVKDATAFYLYFHVQNLAAGAHTFTFRGWDHWEQDQAA